MLKYYFYKCSTSLAHSHPRSNTLVLRHEVTVGGETDKRKKKQKEVAAAAGKKKQGKVYVQFCTECMSHDFASLFVFGSLCVFAPAFCAFVFGLPSSPYAYYYCFISPEYMLIPFLVSFLFYRTTYDFSLFRCFSFSIHYNSTLCARGWRGVGGCGERGSTAILKQSLK